MNDFDNTFEMQPSEDMPQGNVGTTLEWFRTANHKCLLSSKVIKKLGLQFHRKKYVLLIAGFNDFSYC